MTDGPLHNVPSLDRLVLEPASAVTLSAEQAKGLLIQLAGLVPLLMVQATQPLATPPAAPERWLTVEEASQRFGITKLWLYRHKAKLPHSQPSRKTLLFPEQALLRWFTNRR
jgi:hypothetical protein